MSVDLGKLTLQLDVAFFLEFAAPARREVQVPSVENPWIRMTLTGRPGLITRIFLE